MENATKEKNVLVGNLELKINQEKPTVVFVGSKANTSAKTGRVYYTYYFIKTFDGYVKDNSQWSGVESLVESSGVEILGLMPGDEVFLSYGKGFQDKATLVNAVVVGR